MVSGGMVGSSVQTGSPIGVTPSASKHCVHTVVVDDSTLPSESVITVVVSVHDITGHMPPSSLARMRLPLPGTGSTSRRTPEWFASRRRRVRCDVLDLLAPPGSVAHAEVPIPSAANIQVNLARV